MSTRCLIGKVETNGKIRAIYCQHDGYPDGVGQTLVDFYDGSNIDRLLDLGDLSSLGNNPETVPDYWTSDDDYFHERALSGEFCISYRDRGETDIDAKVYNSSREYYRDAKSCWAEFAYLFINNKWFVSDLYQDEDEIEFVSVEDVIKKGHF